MLRLIQDFLDEDLLRDFGLNGFFFFFKEELFKIELCLKNENFPLLLYPIQYLLVNVNKNFLQFISK